MHDLGLEIEEGKALIQISDATSVVKEDTSPEIVMKFGDRGKETGKEVTDHQDVQGAALDLDLVTRGGEAGKAEAGADPVQGRGVGVRGHHLNPLGVAESQKKSASQQVQTENLN